MDGAALLKPLDMILALEPLDDRLFDYRLAVTSAEKRRINRITLDGESVGRAYPLLPFEGTGALKQLLEAPCLKGADEYLHSLGEAGAYIHSRQHIFVAAEEHAAVLGGNIIRTEIAQLRRNERLHAEQARDYKINFHLKTP